MKIKKALSVALALLMLLLLAIPTVSAAKAKSNELTTEEKKLLKQKTEDFLMYWDTFVSEVNGVGDETNWLDNKWRPEQYYFAGEVTDYTAHIIFEYALITSPTGSDYDWQSAHYSDGVYTLSEDEGLSLLNEVLVFKNVKAEEFPFFDKTTRTFIFKTSFDGTGAGGLTEPLYSITQKGNGNYVANVDCKSSDFSYIKSSWKAFTIEFTSDFKIVYFNVDDIDLESAEWKTKPVVTEYKYGEPLKLDGASFIAQSKYISKAEFSRDDSSSWKVKVTPDMVTGYSPEKVGKQTLTVNYYNKSLTFDVIVHNADNTGWHTDGTSHWHTCKCGEILDKTAHTGGTANCHQKANCDVCGAEYGALNPNNHDGKTEIRNAVAATEEKEGYTGDKYCLGCNALLEKGQSVPKLEHTHAMVKTDAKAPTHEGNGNIEYYTCSKCGKLYKDADGKFEITLADTVIDALGHEYSEDYSFDSENHWFECGCGNKIDVAAHEFGEWTVTKKVTETEKGTKERECEVCGYKEIVEIPALGTPTEPTNPVEPIEPTTPDVTDPSVPNTSNDAKSPNTGDGVNMIVWISLLSASGISAFAAIFYGKEKRKAE